MTDETAPRRKAGFRSANRRKVPDTRFRRLIGLCGLTAPEAAEYLGIAEQTVSQKAMGRRTMTADEFKALVELWASIRNTATRLEDDVPEGARRQQHALAEAELFVRCLGTPAFDPLRDLNADFYPSAD